MNQPARSLAALSSLALLSLGVVLPGLLAGCQSGGTGQRVAGAERTDGFPAPDKEIVFDVAVRTLKQQGYAIDVEASSPETGVVQTRWQMSPSPFSGQGSRDMATVWIRDVPGRASYYVVEANVTREKNNDMMQPSNMLKAEWGKGERVPDLERVLTKRIESYFLSNDVSQGMKERYGVATGYDPRMRGVELPPGASTTGR